VPARRKTRIACLRTALFPLAAYLRGAPELAGEAVVVHEGPSARIVAASRLARRAGVRAGLTVAQARNIESGLVSRARDPEREHTAQEVLLEIAGAFSPRIEDGGEGMVYLDIRGISQTNAGNGASGRGQDRGAVNPLLPLRVGDDEALRACGQRPLLQAGVGVEEADVDREADDLPAPLYQPARHDGRIQSAAVGQHDPLLVRSRHLSAPDSRRSTLDSYPRGAV